MKIISTYTDETVNVTGTAMQGRIVATYDQIIETFGQPTYTTEDSADGKVNAEWAIEFSVKDDDGEQDFIVATVYDWKNIELPTGEYLWHIGGFDRRAVDCVHDYMLTKKEATPA